MSEFCNQLSSLENVVKNMHGAVESESAQIRICAPKYPFSKVIYRAVENSSALLILFKTWFKSFLTHKSNKNKFL